MESTTKRVIESLDPFRHLIMPARHDYVVRAETETVENTIALMRTIVRSTLYQTADLAKVLGIGSRLEVCERVYWFVVKHIRYVADSENHEQVRQPARCLADQAGDCDCMSVLVSSILINLGIPHDFRVTGYEKTKKTWWGAKRKYCDDFQHVYVVAYDENENEIIIDPVLDEFNSEAPYCREKSMPLNGLHELRGPYLGEGSESETESESSSGTTEGDSKNQLANAKSKLLDYYKKGSVKVEDLKEKHKYAALISKEVVNGFAPAMLSAEGFNFGNAFENGDYYQIAKQGFVLANAVTKAALNTIIPGGGAIVDVANGIANIFGFANVNEMFAWPILLIADAMSEIPEMQQYLVPTVQLHYTYCEVNAFNPNHDIGWVNKECLICCCRAAGNKWYDASRKMLAELFSRGKKNVEELNFYGIPEKDRLKFHEFARGLRKRVNIYSKNDFKALGLNIDGIDWDEDNIQDLEDLQGLYTWIYSWDGYETYDDESKRGKADLGKWFGRPWFGVNPLSTYELAFDFMNRYDDPTTDLLTGKPIYVLEDGKYRLANDKDIVTPMAIYKSNKYHIEKGAIAGIGATNTYIPMKQEYATELGVSSPEQLVALMSSLDTLYDVPIWKTILTIALPVIGVGVGYGVATWQNNRKNKRKN